ncbi:MAG: polysaccharide deacetylase family protein [Solirubrobacteraceae bacterium]
MTGGYGPGGQARAIVLTFDNLGEASALQRGTWDSRTALGSDPSVTRALPWLLDALDATGLRATFFVEAVNCGLNPAALREIVIRGHELGAHGWEHEVWGALDADTERELLERTTQAFAALGLGARGFRPPGGELTARTPALLRELGFEWCSPADDAAPCIADGLARVPFAWELVDAYHLMERFAPLRERRGEPGAPAAAAAAGARLAAALRDGAGVQTLILHPFLMLEAAWREQVQRLLSLIAGLGAAGRAWVVPGGAFARSLGGAAAE